MSDLTFIAQLRSVLRKTRRRVVACWQRLLERLGLRPVPLRAERVVEVPLDVDPGRIYLVGEGQHLWQAVFKCPCGCGADVQLPLMPEGRPRWDATVHPGGTVSLWPSVDRTVGCQSHFFVRRGRIDWCTSE